MNKIRVVIVEDSELARFELKTLLKSYPQIVLVGEADSVPAAIELFRYIQSDLAFVDIDLPGGSIFDVLDEVESVPALVFTTAFEQHALSSFQFNTIDYLLKPIHQDTLARAVSKIESKLLQPTPPIYAQRIMIKDGEKCWMVNASDIRLVEAIGNYCRVYFHDVAPMIYRSLNKMEAKLPVDKFVRVNRSQLVNLDYVQRTALLKAGLQLTLNDGTQIEVSRRQTARMKQLLSI